MSHLIVLPRREQGEFNHLQPSRITNDPQSVCKDFLVNQNPTTQKFDYSRPVCKGQQTLLRHTPSGVDWHLCPVRCFLGSLTSQTHPQSHTCAADPCPRQMDSAHVPVCADARQREQGCTYERLGTTDLHQRHSVWLCSAPPAPHPQQSSLLQVSGWTVCCCG